MRKVPEWIGKDDDSKPPKAVRARVFAAYGGRCYLSKRLIRAGDDWDLEHIEPLWRTPGGRFLCASLIALSVSALVGFPREQGVK